MRRHLLYFAMDFKTVLRDRQNRLYAAARLRGDLVCLAGTRQDIFCCEGAVLNVREKARLMDEAAVNRALMRLSHEIAERNRGVENVCLVGIRRRGEPMARQIRSNIIKIEGLEVPCGSVDVRYYRDDLQRLSQEPIVTKAQLDFPVADKTVVLVDRGHRELPIRADYVGKNVPTSHTELIEARLPEYDGETGVYLMEP